MEEWEDTDQEDDTIITSQAEIGVGIFLGVCDSLVKKYSGLETFISSPEFQDVYRNMRLMVGKVMADEVRNNWFYVNKKRFIKNNS